MIERHKAHVAPLISLTFISLALCHAYVPVSAQPEVKNAQVESIHAVLDHFEQHLTRMISNQSITFTSLPGLCTACQNHSTCSPGYVLAVISEECLNF